MRVSENKSSTVDILSDWVILVCRTPERSIGISSLDALTVALGLLGGHRNLLVTSDTFFWYLWAVASLGLEKGFFSYS